MPKHKSKSRLRGERQAISRRWMFAIILVALVVVASKVFTAVTKQQSPLDSAIIGVTTPVVFVVKRIGDGITYTVGVLAHFPTLLREKKELKAENEWLSRKVEELKHVEGENDQLHQLLKTPVKAGFTNIAANVIARPYDIVLESVWIGIGRNKGVAAGNLVVNETGVVGTIAEVFSSYSRVTLAVSEKSYLWAMTRGGVTEGLLVGAGGTTLNMNQVKVGAEIELGDKVFTKGRKSVGEEAQPPAPQDLLKDQPEGVYIGIVVTKEVGRDGYLKLKVDPAASPNRISTVMVMVLDK